MARPLGTVWPPWGRGPSPGHRVASVGAWPVPWAPRGSRGGVAGPMRTARPPWGRGRSQGTRVAAVGALPAPCASCGRRGGVAGPLSSCGRRGGVAGPLVLVWPSWGRGRNPGLRVADVGAWPDSWPSVAAGVAWPFPSASCVRREAGLDDLIDSRIGPD